MPEIRIPLDADRTKIFDDNGSYLDIHPVGYNANYLSPENQWCECDISSTTIKTGSSGSSRDIYDKLPLTVGVRTDYDAEELVTLRLSKDQSKETEITVSLLDIIDDGISVDFNLLENSLDGNLIHKGHQSLCIADGNSVKLLTPKADIKSRTVVYALTVPSGYSIQMNETTPEIHSPEGYLRSIKAHLLGADYKPLSVDAINLTVCDLGPDPEGRHLYTITKTSKVDLSSLNCSFVLDAGGANDLHFRKTDGTLIPAFSRTITKDANNAITQLDCRLSVDVTDLSGLKLCYGDPAYSDFAVDPSQVIGNTIAEAEASPLKGTFWDYEQFATTLIQAQFHSAAVTMAL